MPSSSLSFWGLEPPSMRIAPSGPRSSTACPSPTFMTIAWGGALAHPARAAVEISTGASVARTSANPRPGGGRCRLAIAGASAE